MRTYLQAIYGLGSDSVCTEETSGARDKSGPADESCVTSTPAAGPEEAGSFGKDNMRDPNAKTVVNEALIAELRARHRPSEARPEGPPFGVGTVLAWSSFLRGAIQRSDWTDVLAVVEVIEREVDTVQKQRTNDARQTGRTETQSEAKPAYALPEDRQQDRQGACPNEAVPQCWACTATATRATPSCDDHSKIDSVPWQRPEQPVIDWHRVAVSYEKALWLIHGMSQVCSRQYAIDTAGEALKGPGAAKLPVDHRPGQPVRTRCQGCGHFDNELVGQPECYAYGARGHWMLDVDKHGIAIPPDPCPTNPRKRRSKWAKTHGSGSRTSSARTTRRCARRTSR